MRSLYGLALVVAGVFSPSWLGTHRISLLPSLLSIVPPLGTLAAMPVTTVGYFQNMPARIYYFDDTPVRTCYLDYFTIHLANALLALAQSILYFDGMGGDVYRSGDEGKSWDLVDGVPRHSAAQLVEHPFDNRVARHLVVFHSS